MASLSATCKRFDRIFSEHTTLKDVLIEVDFDTHNLPAFKRPYPNAVIKNLSDSSSPKRSLAVKTFFKTSGTHFKTMTFKYCTVTDGLLETVLNACPKLQSLTFTSCQILKMRNSTDRAPRLTRLADLELEYKVMKPLVNILSNVNTLQKIVLIQPSSDTALTLSSYDAFKPVIARQTGLKTLEIADGEFFRRPFENIKFQLERLVLFVPMLNSPEDSNMLKFITSQNQIKECIFNIMTRAYSKSLNESLVNVINQKSMGKLKIIFYNQSGMNVVYRDLEIVNPNLKELYLSVRQFDHSYRRFIETTRTMFPNLTSLHIKLDKEWCNPMHTSCLTFGPLNDLKKLESLTLENFETRLCLDLHFPKLKLLKMLSPTTSNGIDWKILFTNNPLIENVYVNCGDDLPEQLAIQVFESSILQLQHLISVFVCINGQEISKQALRRLAHFALINGTASLKKLQICGWRFKI